MIDGVLHTTPAQRPLNYDSPRALKAFLDAHGLGMRKKFGQHFLINPEARKSLLDALDIGPGDGVWEIGPGLGAMTWGLLERGVRVKAFELDPGFIRVLTDFFGADPRFCLVPGDVLKTWPHAGEEGYMLGNLPYTIGSRLLGAFIEGNRFFKRMVVLLQRELVQRLRARPGSKDYSSFSVLCTSAYTIKPLHIVKGSSFYPVPHVDSQGIRLDLRTDVDPRAYPPGFRPLVRGLFASRRKTITHNLYNFVVSYILAPQGVPPGAEAAHITEEALKRCGIPGNKRAEALGLEAFAALAAVLEGIKNREAVSKGSIP
ncbi:MAG: 16S rRNA (adenine(1518)-N(6)/adenine(1519)-N(6))-dimethyltransferase RsmA [Treponema sp.]|nr:16S rRNA (adenine(1518)-N(6)/adenine(1519)-N(6))-dimethyltransferase RsmA [Treponema sp.]